MAAPLRVKEKSAWKTVNIPKDLLDKEEFDGLVDIQELTDYDLIPFEVSDEHESSLVSGKKAKRKRKGKGVEENEFALNENVSTESPQTAKKRRKKNNSSINPEANGDVGTDNDRSILDANLEDGQSNVPRSSGQRKKENNSRASRKNLSRLRKLDGKGGEFVGGQNVDLVTDETSAPSEMLVGKVPHEGSEVKGVSVSSSGGEQHDTVSKRKKRKKKRQCKNDSASPASENVDDTDSFNVLLSSETNDKVVGEISTDPQGTKKKKRKRNKKTMKQASENKSDVDSVSVESSPKTSDQEKKGIKKKKKKMKRKRTNIEEEKQQPPPISPEKKSKLDMSQWKNLYVPDVLLEALEEQQFGSPTMIQTLALPSAIRDRKDILGAAETGSGKTLAFGIPLLAKILNYDKSDQSPEPEESEEEEMEVEIVDYEGQSLTAKSKRKASHNPPLALILEPTRELAVQVKKHLTAVAKHTDIKFATVVGGMSVEKQRRILGKNPQVIIATPGRLWQLIEEGNEHLSQVDRVLCLVVDEADRMVEKGHYEELTKLMEMMNKSPRRAKHRQTFVMSATLTMDVSAPKRLLNKKKKRVKEEDKLKTLTERIGLGRKPKVIDLTPKDKVAQTLTELRVNCKADEKDFYLYYFLCQHPGRTLVFANSKDCLRRLVSLFTLLECSPLPLHADMHQRQRLKNLDRFSENSKALLVASDVAARGLDIPNVDHVIHYQVPRTMENYVHRSGRTARASNLGLSVMLVGPEDARDYRKIVAGVRNGEELPLLPVEMDLLPSVKQRVGLAREIDVKEHRIKKKRNRNNFFTRAAQEMDMIVDDKNLLEDMGDSVEQAEDKTQLRQLRKHLTSLLKASLAPLQMTKYPTKSGQLAAKQMVNLHRAR